MTMYFVIGVREGEEIVSQGLVMRLQELEWLGHTGHGLGRTPNYFDKFLETALFVVQ